MKFILVISIILTSLLSCGQKKRPLKGETVFQKELNASYKDVTHSPLKPEDRKHFMGLDFFKVDSSYVVTATLKRTPDSPWFKMPTTTSRVSQERIFGDISFTLKGKTYSLHVYQNKELMTKEGFEAYLFLPFLDLTNGETTYGGGRYIDTSIPDGDTLVIDFNTAYNPYCAYNEKYSCPIVPRANFLNTKVEAGVKRFKKTK